MKKICEPRDSKLLLKPPKLVLDLLTALDFLLHGIYRCVKYKVWIGFYPKIDVRTYLFMLLCYYLAQVLKSKSQGLGCVD